MDLPEIAEALTADLQPLRFSKPVAYVYNPLEYARGPHEEYLRRYGRGRPEVLLLGMNPGPWGMVQTGVPFGEVGVVRDWLGIKRQVGRPKREHPKRPALGFACTRSEISGARLWGWARDKFKTPKRFFSRFFVVNYCPLAFLEQSGRNLTPDRLATPQKHAVINACDLALRRTVEHIKPRWVIGVGVFAEARALAALCGIDVTIGRILHPSPASPAANRGWAPQATRQLSELGIKMPGV